jgi:hypothetical protein
VIGLKPGKNRLVVLAFAGGCALAGNAVAPTTAPIWSRTSRRVNFEPIPRLLR